MVVSLVKCGLPTYGMLSGREKSARGRLVSVERA